MPGTANSVSLNLPNDFKKRIYLSFATRRSRDLDLLQKHVWNPVKHLRKKIVNPLSASVIKCQCQCIKCTANQLTGFYMRATLALNGLKSVILDVWQGSEYACVGSPLRKRMCSD